MVDTGLDSATGRGVRRPGDARIDAHVTRLSLAGLLVGAALAALGAGALQAQPAPRAVAGTLIFSSDADGDTDVFTVAAGGGRVYSLSRNYDNDSISSLDGTVARQWRGNVSVLRSDGGWRPIGSGRLIGVYDRGRRIGIEESATLLIATANGRQRWRLPLRGEASIAPDGQHVAFTERADDGESSTLVLTAVGKRTSRKLGSGSSVSSSWSPDGSLLLVRIDRAETAEYRLVEVRSSRPPRLVSRGDLGDGRWSPDGLRIVFVRSAETGAVVTVVETRSGRRWASKAASSPGNLAWSADGVRFAYIESRADGQHVVVANARTRSSRGIAHSAGISSGPFWAPDGSRIAYVEGQTDSAAAVVVAAAGGSRRVLARGRSVVLIDWSPDSRRLLLALPGAIRVVGTDGRLHGSSPASFPAPSQVVWSPGGEAVAFAAGYGGESIYVLRGDGTRLTRLTRRGHDRIVAWLPSPVPARAHAAPAVPPTERPALRTLDTRGPVAALSADGAAAGVLVAAHELDCIHPVVWRQGRGVVRVGTPAPCLGEGAGVPFDVELTSSSIRWSQFSCGNDCYLSTYRSARAPTDQVTWLGETAFDGAPEPPLPPVETHRGVSILVQGGVVRLRRLSDGVDRIVRAADGRIFDAELEDDGLFYAFNRPRGVFRGRVVFVPFDQLFSSAP